MYLRNSSFSPGLLSRCFDVSSASSLLHQRSLIAIGLPYLEAKKRSETRTAALLASDAISARLMDDPSRSLSILTDLESAQRSGFGMWLLRHDDFLYIIPVFVPENVPAFFSKLSAAR
jgi:hypothetical protein